MNLSKTRKILALILPLCLLVAQAGLIARAGEAEKEKPADKLPPELTHYMGRKIAQTMHFTGAPWLVRESRQREEDCVLLLKNLAAKPGQYICDMGCGNGFYTVPLAKAVGDTGKVFAVEIQQEMLDLLKIRAAAANADKPIVPLLGTTVDPKLPDGKLDLILLVDVYHEFSNPEEMLAAMRKSLKPDGLIALVEFRAEDAKVPIKTEHKMSKEQILKEYPANGFKLAKEFDGLPWQHLMYFKIDPDWKKK